MFFRLGYNLFLSLLFLGYLPRLFYHRFRFGKYKGHLLSRLGFCKYHFSDKTSRRIWIHAISLGETKAVIPLVKRLKQEYPDKELFFSTTTETGLNEAKKNLEGVFHDIFLLPFDLFVRRLVRKARPDLLILTEGDLWFNLVDQVKRQGGAVVLVNGKMSERSARFWESSHLFSFLCRGIDRFILQSEIYKERFRNSGAPEERLVVSGNLKWDMTPLTVSSDEIAGLSAQPVITFGSTHPGEEAMIIKVLRSNRLRSFSPKVFLVPRHPERVKEVAALLHENGIIFSYFSTSTNSPCILVDKMGVLNSLYAISDIACVAGSWSDKVGGHNILEPLFFGKALVFGPFMYAQPDLEKAVLEARAGIQIGEDKLEETLYLLLQDKKLCQDFGVRGQRLVNGSKGSLERTMLQLQPWLSLKK